MKKLLLSLILCVVFCSVKAQDSITVPFEKIITVTGTVKIAKPKPVTVHDTVTIKLPCDQAGRPERKALYIDEAVSRIKSANDRTILDLIFDPTKTHGREQKNFNEAWFYLQGIFSDPAALKLLGDWISKQHKLNPYFQAGCVENFAAAFAYNKSQTDTTRRFDLFVYEREYWNATNILAEFTAVVSAMKSDSIKYVGKFGIKGLEFYNGHFKDPVRSKAPRFFATYPVSLHDYMDKPGDYYVQYRKDSLNSAGAKEYGPITSSEFAFWGPEIAAIGYDSCIAIQKKAYLAKGYKMKWTKTVHFDFEHYVYYTFGAAGSPVARMAFVVTPPKELTTEKHLKMSQE